MRMPANSRASRVLLFSTIFLFITAFVAAQVGQQAVGENARHGGPPSAGVSSSDRSKYVGAATCKTCHEETYNAWEKTAHWKTTLNKEGGADNQGCEGG